MNKREPGPNDQYIEACLYYGKNRKEQFLNRIKECIDDNYLPRVYTHLSL
jgi:hypothetical protein